MLVSQAALAQQLEPVRNESAIGPGAAPAAARVTFGTNFFVDPCGTCKYSEAGGYFVVGPDNCIVPDTTQWLGVPFIASTTGVPEQISAPIILADPTNCPTNKVTLSIYTDACYPTGPGTPLVSAVAPTSQAPCGLAVARLAGAPTLLKGEKYWVVATTTLEQAGLDSNWYGSNNAKYAISTGTSWEQFSGGTPAFMVKGSGVTFSERAPEASHPAFGGNLFVDPCTGCNYDSNGSGFDVRGPRNCTSPGTVHWDAVPFVAAKSGVPKRVSASIILRNAASCPENKVTLSLYTDDCDLGPGTPLVSGVATVPTAPCDLATAKLRNAPSLQKGVKYWVVASTTAQQAGLDASWYGSNDAQYAIGPGFEWTQFNAVTPAFLVQ
jgi:hypothetical protein